MTRILSPLVVGYLDNSNCAQLAQPFGFISDVLIKHGLRQVGWESRPPGHEDEFWLQTGFVFDFESTPNWLRGPLGVNKRGGTSHDGTCRKNALVCWNGACKGITKGIAADVYFEIMEFCDSIDTQRFAESKHPLIPNMVIVPFVRIKDWLRRWMKSTTVRFWPGDFFLKYELTATAKEIYGMDCDPYVTMDKIDSLIKKTEKVSADLKEVNIDTTEMVKQTDQVTEELKDVKTEIKESI